jgi:hypothetical protein
VAFWAAVAVAFCIGAAAMWLLVGLQSNFQKRDYSGFKHHAKVHTFRITTAIAAWLLIVAAFYYHPEWIKWALRTVTGGIETAADAVPYPWGDRVEIVLRELGGFVWFQVTLAILALRLVCSLLAAMWRRLRP